MDYPRLCLLFGGNGRKATLQFGNHFAFGSAALAKLNDTIGNQVQTAKHAQRADLIKPQSVDYNRVFLPMLLQHVRLSKSIRQL
jgi:hypothetical protein